MPGREVEEEVAVDVLDRQALAADRARSGRPAAGSARSRSRRTRRGPAPWGREARVTMCGTGRSAGDPRRARRQGAPLLCGWMHNEYAEWISPRSIAEGPWRRRAVPAEGAVRSVATWCGRARRDRRRAVGCAGSCRLPTWVPRRSTRATCRDVDARSRRRRTHDRVRRRPRRASRGLALDRSTVAARPRRRRAALGGRSRSAIDGRPRAGSRRSSIPIGSDFVARSW